MKQGKIIGIALAVVNAILIIICAVMYLRADRTAPEFSFQASDIRYRQGMDTQELLAGITAYDRTDGDVTDRIVIEKITENHKDSVAIVFYAVSDLSGNVAKTSKQFQAVYDQEAENFMEAGINAEFSKGSNSAGTAESDCQMEEASTLPGTPLPSEPPKGLSASPAEPFPSSGMPSPSQAPRPTVRPIPTTPPPAPETEQDQNQSQDQSQEAPVLTLKVSEVRVPAGQGPAWVDIIGTLSDDKDDYNTLFQNLNVSRYDRNKAGTYQVSVYTEDSEGNKSQSVPLTIIVE